MARTYGYEGHKKLQMEQAFDRLWSHIRQTRDTTENEALSNYFEQIPPEDLPHLLRAALRATPNKSRSAALDEVVAISEDHGLYEP